VTKLKAAIGRIWNGHKRLLLGVGMIALVAIIAGGTALAMGDFGLNVAQATPTSSPSASSSASPSASPSGSPTASPTVDLNPTPIPSGWVYSDLDGVPAPPDLAHALPLAVMVDDNAVARPQSGISSASIVYQAMADGGEDRYMFVFQEGTATDIGPTRSGRPYYVYWAAEYKALFTHVGGDAETLQVTVPAMSKYIYNMDELNGGSCAFHRITTRAAPHNDYTSSPTLISCAAKRGYPATYQKLPTRPFQDAEPAFARPAAQTVTIPYRTGTIGYQYDPTTDMYLRTVDGQPEIDPANNSQVMAADIAVMFQTYAMEPSLDEMRPVVGNVGSGKAIVYKEGLAIQATWKKTSNTALTRFYDTSGAEIPFVRGEIFMQSVPIGTAVTSK
jgi:Protein of unknown function (DUF3048) N-terminal domain/Protein of unknown function (DUF3048) C-terminal domain